VQVVATMTVNKGEYKLYAPNGPSGIKFNIYDASGVTLLAKTSSYTFTNNSSDARYEYSILLSHINLESGQSALVNGTLYRVKAEVTLVDHSGDTETRESVAFTDMTFSQNVAPVLNLNISNTWALSTNDNPSSNTTHFDNSPLIGVSGYFKKNAQFNSSYTKHLDVASTKFKLEYSVDSSSNWIPVKKAVLIQKLSSESMAEAVYRARGTSPVSSTNGNGKYDNVIGSGVGTSQEEMVFYIPQEQQAGVNAFTESNIVQVRVTVIDTAQLWGGTSYEASSNSNSLQLINRIADYDFIINDPTEPYNIQHNAYYDNNTSLLHVDVNGTIVTSNISNVLADSNPITSVVNGGLRVVNTGVGTNSASSGTLPKVNLYTYGNIVPAAYQTTSNSFTVSQINGLGAYYIIDQKPTAVEYPFMIIYTTPTSSGNNGSWFKSKLFYAPSLSGNTVIDSSKVGLTLLYTGTDDGSFRSDIPSHRRVKCNLVPMDLNNPNSLTMSNNDYANEFVNYVTLQTSSNASTSSAGNFNFVLSEAGLTTNSSVLQYIVMRFTLKLSLNIPVDWKSIHGHSVIVKSGYSSNNLNTTTTANYPDTFVTVYVNPNSGTTLYYTVQYVVNNVNLGVSQTTAGVTSDEENVPNKFFPENSDYSITSTSYKTFNTGGESSIEFTLDVSANPLNRIDGVNVYFESPNHAEGSNISAVRIGTYLFSATGSKTIQILDASGVYFQKLDASGNIAPVPNTWGNFDLANISFKAYRDRRVISDNASYNTLNYVESGINTTSFNTIWNVPKLYSPSADGQVILDGGVRNSSATTKLSWTQTQNDNQINFKYDLTMQKNSVSTLIHNISDLDANFKDLSIDLNNNAKYTVTLRKVFYPSTAGAIREVSDPVDTITFHTIHVNVNNMDIRVEDPSNVEKVNLSWNEPLITAILSI